MPTKPRDKKTQAPRPHPLHDMDVFNAMMERCRRKAMASLEALRQALADTGIHTKPGKLTKPYR